MTATNNLNEQVARALGWERSLKKWWFQRDRSQPGILLPNFAESMDECLRWVVPEMLSRALLFQIYKDHVVCSFRRDDNSIKTICGNTMPLALCKAFLSLKGGEANQTA